MYVFVSCVAFVSSSIEEQHVPNTGGKAKNQSINLKKLVKSHARSIMSSYR